MRTVSEVSELAGVTVRTLHHYDELGLLSPSARSDAGYRLYSAADLARLQEIVVWRRLGFSLAEIRALLDDRAHDRVLALRRQRELVEAQLERLRASARALDAALAAHANGTEPQEETMFDGLAASDFEDEARERWGHTDAYRESAARTARYGEREWREIRAQSEQITTDFAAALAAGEPASAESVRAIAERHRRHISEWFYPCSPQLHRGLGELYVADLRFAAGFEGRAEGLAAYVRDAIVANADGVEATAGS